MVCFSAVTVGVAVADDSSDVSARSTHVTLDADDIVDVAPGATVEIEFEIENTGTDTVGVDLSASSLYDYSDELILEEFDADGAVWYEDDRYWSGPNLNPVRLSPGESRTPSITLTIAESTAGQSFDIPIESLEQNVSDTMRINVADDDGSSAPDSGDDDDDRQYTDLSLSADDIEASPGETVDMTFEVTNTGNKTTDIGLDASGQSLSDLSDNITTIESFNDDDGTWSEDDRYWETSELAPGEQQSPSLTIAVAENATSDSFELPVELVGRNINDTAVLTITDDGSTPDNGTSDDNATTGVVVERTPQSTTVAPGESVDITVDVTSDKQNIELITESIATNAEIANITAASSEAAQVPTELPSDSIETVYLSPVDEDILTYTVSIAEGATDGDTIELSGTVADSGGNETGTGTTTIEVSRFSIDRTPVTETASPGDTVDVSVGVTGPDASIDILDESIASGDTDGLEIVNASADTAQAVVSDDGTSVSVPHTASVDSVNLSYTLAVSESAAAGETLNISGSVAGSSTANQADTGMTTVEVTDNPYANQKGQVDTNGLIKAITDWRETGLSVQELLDVIEQWRSRSP